MKSKILLVWLLGAAPACASAPQAEKPNIVVILADDMGYSDPGCFGGEIATPAIDRLAGEGVRLARFHNCGMCVVSRASLMTGQWWPRGLREFRKTPLLPEKLRERGYRTALIGKWHLDGDPMDRGFDHFFGFLGGFSDHFKGGPGYRLDRGDFKDFGPDFYSSDAFADRAIRFIGSASDKPFFLCLSYQAPHNPLQAPRGLIDPYRGKYLKGWQAVREERFRRQKEMGIVSADVELPAYPLNLPAWDSLSPAQKDLEDLRRAVYAAMVGRMDESIGRVMDCLRASGKADNTLVLFLSDNGADPFSVADEAMLKQNKLPGDPGSNYQNGVGWAYAGATPWRLYKISQHGGGVTSGAIARWPGKLGKPGRIERAPLHVADVMPMLLDAADPGGPDAGLAGVSFLPLLRGEPWRREGPLCFQYLDNRALRDDEWTLVEADGAGWELFRTSDDYLEIRDLAASRPETVARLADQWLSWWKRESGSPHYTPESSSGSPHYKPQGDLGSGAPYVPSAMPKRLSGRYPVPK